MISIQKHGVVLAKKKKPVFLSPFLRVTGLGWIQDGPRVIFQLKAIGSAQISEAGVQKEGKEVLGPGIPGRSLLGLTPLFELNPSLPSWSNHDQIN